MKYAKKNSHKICPNPSDAINTPEHRLELMVDFNAYSTIVGTFNKFFDSIPKIGKHIKHKIFEISYSEGAASRLKHD